MGRLKDDGSLTEEIWSLKWEITVILEMVSLKSQLSSLL